MAKATKTQEKEDADFVKEIRRVKKESYDTYGARRIKEQLEKDGINCGKIELE